MDDVTEPLPDSLTGRTSFVRAMAAELADNRPFDGFLDWDWDWLRSGSKPRSNKGRAHGGIRTQLESVALVSFPGLGCGMLAGRGRFTSVMENSGKKLPKKRGGVAGKNPGSESHPRTTESAQYGSAVHEAKTSGIVSNEHFIKREWLTLFRAADSRCGIQCAVAAIFVHISSRNTLMIPEIHKRSQCFAQSCKFAEPARICLEAKMLPSHISIICTRPLGRIDNVALKRWALFTVE